MGGLRNYGYGRFSNGITEKRKRLKELRKEGKELHIEWCNLEFNNLHCFNLDIEEERFEYEQMCDLGDPDLGPELQNENKSVKHI